MNEQIREFSKKAKEYADGYDDRSTPIWYQKYEENFAELILKECISLMDRQKAYYADPGTYESSEYYDRCEAKESAFDEAADSIKYNFDIK